MKDNKLILFILIVVVCGIWFKLFKKVWSNLTSENAKVSLQNSNRSFEFKIVSRDTFVLNKNYSDPFRINLSQKNEESHLSNVGLETKKPKEIFREDKILPEIKFKGIIKKDFSKEPLVILLVDGNLLYVRSNDFIYEDIKILGVNKDKITLKNKKEIFNVWREK